MIAPLLNLKRCWLTLLAAFTLLVPFALNAAGSPLAFTPDTASREALPDAHGFAGMAAGSFTDDAGQPYIIAVGGANFPGGRPWEGATKVFHKTIWKGQAGKWTQVGELPRPVAYAAFATSPKGLVIAGGCNADGHTAAAWLIRTDKAATFAQVVELAPLPEPLAYAAFASENKRLCVFGGQSTPTAAPASRSAYRLVLTDIDPDKPAAATWEKLPDIPGDGRILATAGALDGKIHIFGGCSLAPDDKGQPVRTYLKSGLGFNANYNAATTGSIPWLYTAPADMPDTLAACANPAPAREGLLLFIGGDNGSHYGKPPQTHPGQSAKVIAYDPRANTWTPQPDWPVGLATAPAVVSQYSLSTVSGETGPGVRTPAVASAKIGYTLHLNTVDWCVFGLGLLAIIAIGMQVAKKGLSRTTTSLAKGDGAMSAAAWGAVGLLFVVAMLNYMDRQLLTAMQPPIVRDIPQTDKQFGLLTAVFLFIYSALSPVGGILADRFSRRLVILVSLIVWSAVTWITGHVEDYNQLLVARALMGISEACYIPAALALITDFHRGKTRSLATGLHMSGIYAGQALAGIGGYVAEGMGWRLTFAIFGLVGVAYALVLILFLKEPSDDTSAANASGEKDPAQAATPKPSIGAILGSVLKTPAFWLLMAIMGCASVANWFILSWLPLLLKEKFNLSLGEAGLKATTPSSIAKYAAVIIGALIADAWSRSNSKARALIPGIGFIVAGPMIMLVTQADTLFIFITCVVFQGIAQGFLDANLMPVLRSHIDERYAATGYGFLNLVGAGVGGLSVVYGGQLKDAGIPLTTTLACSGVALLVCGITLLLLPRPHVRTPQ